MTDFKGIRGWKVQTLSSDPVASLVGTGSWASGGSTNNSRENCGSTGTQTSNLIFGGPSTSGQTESYNGTSWTEVNDLNTGRNTLGGAGASNTSALAFAGFNGATYVTNNETWDGTSWTETTDMNTARYAGGSTGTQTSAIFAGGYSTTVITNTEVWNGSSWTEVAEFNDSRYQATGIGHDSEAVLLVGGGTPTSASAEKYNGTSWTEVSDINTARNKGGGSGTDILSLFYSGVVSSTGSGLTEAWDNSSWTEVADMAAGRAGGGDSNTGTQSAALVSTGNKEPGIVTDTEEFTITATTFSKLNLGQVYFNSTANAFKVTEQPVPGGSWASGANLNTVRDFHAMAATSSDAAIAFGGNPGSTANTEQYDGSSWTEKNNLNTGRNSLRGFGTVSAAIGAGGYAPTGTMNNVESWDGTNWTEVNEINSARQNPGRGGTQTAGILFGGYTTAKSAVTETWDGTSWTEVADMNTSGDYISSFGSQTSAIAGNRYQPGVSPGYTENVVESWNGTSWTETAEMNTARAEMSGEVGATGDLGLIAGGTPNGAGPAKIANTELWNGSSWTEVSDLGTARRNYGAGGPSASGILTGGDGDTDGTEEWTAPLTNKTITVS